MTYIEQAVTFECNGDSLVGITSVPEKSNSSTGVLVVVGGPQYRVGSHRQFVLLCRELARQGISSMRFDCRGMGDSTGSQRSFEAIDEDIRAAIDCFSKSAPEVDRIVLWALCDGASAACFYAPQDARLAGLVLLNPWVRTDSGEAKTHLKHYYLRRLFEKDFWRKLLQRRVAVGDSIRNLFRALRLARTPVDIESHENAGNLPSRMAVAVERSGLPLLLILSGNDYVANEFEAVCREQQSWSKLKAAATVRQFPNADHTFSRVEWRDAVAQATADWVLRD